MNPLLAKYNIVLDPILPAPLILFIGLLLGGVTGVIYIRVGSRLRRSQNLVLLLFRWLGIAAILALLLQPSYLQHLSLPPIQPVIVLAVDTSGSMNQKDVKKESRLQAAKNLLYDAELVPRDALIKDASWRLFEFNADAAAIHGSLLPVVAQGTSTRFHKSIQTILSSLTDQEAAQALVLFTDGHDLELVNPTKTGFIARSRRMPIYAVAFGQQGKVRDISIRIANYQPYCYVKQKARLGAVMRLVGCEFEDLQIQLVRQNQVVQTQRLNVGEQQQIPVQFEVTETEVGQYEYEIRVVPVEREVDTNNNSTMTFLNVIDQQIRVLLLEGSPYWDTTFLQRSLMRNDKVSLDAIIQYAPNKVRYIREEGHDPLRIPNTPEQWSVYDVVILGRFMNHLMDRQQLQLLDDYVKERGGTVIFSRGQAFEGDLANNALEPVIWSNQNKERLRIQASREGQSLAPFQILSQPGGGAEALPDMIAGRQIAEHKPLTSTLADAQSADGGETLPAMVHRRYGQGQLLSVGVTGLWRWAFNAKIEGVNTLFDRFWDQMILWLIAAQDFVPARQYAFRSSSANIALGEKIYFRLVTRQTPEHSVSVPLTIYYGTQLSVKTAFSTIAGQNSSRQSVEYLPEKTGRFRAVATFPDGTEQASQFMVYSENLEETEVATDTAYLKKLCESSGGRLLAPEDLGACLAQLGQTKVENSPHTQLISLWDQAWIFWLIGLLFGIDWYLRRRWGLC